MMTMASPSNPATTKAVKKGNDLSQNSDRLSSLVISLTKADMALSRAEASVGKTEATEITCAKITIIALFLAAFAKIVIAILALKGKCGL
jgi:hypothetical protein